MLSLDILNKVKICLLYGDTRIYDSYISQGAISQIYNGQKKKDQKKKNSGTVCPRDFYIP